MNAIAIFCRTTLHLLALALVVKKAWLGDMLSIPLAQLNWVGRLWVLMQAAIGFGLGTFLVVRMVTIPSRDKQDAEWRFA